MTLLHIAGFGRASCETSHFDVDDVPIGTPHSIVQL